MSKKKGANGADAIFELQDIVLAKVKGHPAWPARVIDPETAPENLKADKKRQQKNTYLVKFFQSGDFSYLRNSELNKLDKVGIQAYLDDDRKKGADLREAYKIALDPTEWDALQVQRQKEMEEAAVRLQNEIKNREEDELDGEGEEGAGKKRKRKSESKPKEAKKRKADGEGKESKKSKAAKAAAAVPDEEPGLTKVRGWRQKLQRTFLTPDQPVKAEQMPEIDEIFKDIESFEMKAEWLTGTKLAKVLKRVAAMTPDVVPEDETYNIRQRSRDLQQKWASSFGSGEVAATTGDEPADAAAIPEPEKPLVANGAPAEPAPVAPLVADVEMSEAAAPIAAPAPLPVHVPMPAPPTNGTTAPLVGADAEPLLSKDV